MKKTLKICLWMVSAVFTMVVYCMVFSCSFPVPVISQVYAENATPLDYSIVATIDSDDLRSLKNILFGDHKLSKPAAVSVASQNPSVSSRNFPQILYDIDRGGESEAPQADGTVKFSVGNSIILNRKGFFVTAYHCVENFGKASTSSRKNMLMMYGPMRNMVMKGRILSFSEKYDLALGQVDLPDDIHVEDVRIAQARIEPSQVLYAKRFSNLNYIKSDLLTNMLFPDSADMRRESDLSSVFLRDPDPNWRRPLGLEVCVGYAVGLKNPAGLSIAGPKPGQYFLMTGTQQTVEGHSGSPIYSVNGDLSGIVVEIPRSTTSIKNSKGEPVRITYFTGPEKIRELIDHYIAACAVAGTQT